MSKLYYFGSDMSLLYIYEAFTAFFDLLDLDKSYCSIVGKNGKGFMLVEKCREFVIDFFDKQKEDVNFVEDYIQKWVDLKNKKEEFILNFDYEVTTKKSVIHFFKTLTKLRYNQWFNGLIVEFLDPIDENVLDSELKKYGVELSELEKNLIQTPMQMSFLKEYELDLIKCVMNKISIADLEKKYYFIKNDWARVFDLNENFFLKEIEKIQSFNLDDEEKNILEESEKTNLKVDEIIKRHSIPKDLQNIIYALRRLAYFRDMRKISMQKTHHYIYKIITFIHHDLNLPVEDLLYLTSKELIDLLENDVDYYDEINLRKEYLVYFCEKGEYYIYSGNKAKKKINLLNDEFNSQFDRILGRPAFMGCVKGRVCIVKGHDDFFKFRKGDVLVAPMTRPEYMPLLKDASAIVTDEGGITCHAAIVSRELKIPCIIGTQNATHVLKDGEIIIVDANKGEIKNG